MGTNEAFAGLDRIALSFSGGGFRAASFSLGCLSYLDAVHYKNERLLDKVKFISSTSGGSITSLMYAASHARGEDFSAFFQNMLGLLQGEKLLSSVMAVMDNDTFWKDRPGKERNFINAFSLVYDRDFFGHTTLGDLFPADKPFHLEEICVNSTEFTNGLAFRFHAQQKGQGLPEGLVGNAYIHFYQSARDVSGRLLLADILASSSCFPSGFEPLIFPDDYTYAGLSRDEIISRLAYKANPFTLRRGEEEGMSVSEEGTGIEAEFKATMEAEKEEPAPRRILPDQMQTSEYDFFCSEAFKQELHVGIMDGGIVDNQAVDAMRLAHKRRSKAQKPGFDVFMPCDVTSFLMDGYCLPLQRKGFFMSRSLLLYLILLVILFVVPLCILRYASPGGSWRMALSFWAGILAIPVLGLICIAGKYFVWDRLIKRKKSAFYVKHIPALFRLPLGAVIQMVQARIKSVVMLSGDVYLKHIRRMYYNALFTDAEMKSKIVHTMIYDLSRVKSPHASKEGVPPPSEAVIEVAENARRMPTTLWFDPDHQQKEMLKALITTGQFTACYNLLKFLKKQNNLSGELQGLMNTLESNWAAFNADPYWMWNSGIAGS